MVRPIGFYKDKEGRTRPITHRRQPKIIRSKKMKTKIIAMNQVTGGSFELAMHDVILDVNGERYYVPAVHGHIINRLTKEGRLYALTNLSGTRKL